MPKRKDPRKTWQDGHKRTWPQQFGLLFGCGAPTESPASCWSAPRWWNHQSWMMGWPPSDSCMTVQDLCGAAPVASPSRAFFCYVKSNLTIWFWMLSQQLLADLILLSFSVRCGLKTPQKQNNTWGTTVSMVFQGAVGSKTCSQQKLLVKWHSLRAAQGETTTSD